MLTFDRRCIEDEMGRDFVSICSAIGAARIQIEPQCPASAQVVITTRGYQDGEEAFQAEQIIGKLREAEVTISNGRAIGQLVQKLGITEQTYYRWRKE